MANITYTDKNKNGSAPANQWRDVDANEVKTAVNSKADQTSLNAHTANTSNPHNTTKAQVGLSNVDNTSDANKPISTATQTALDAKVPTSRTITINGQTFDLSDNRSWTIATNVGSVAWGSITGTLSGQTDLQNALNGKANTSHTQAISTITGLQTALDGKVDDADLVAAMAQIDAEKANTSHTHTISDVTGLQTALNNKTRTYTFLIALGGNAATGTNVTNQLIIERNATITAAYINAKTAPTGADLIVDININGSTIWSTQANRLRLTAGSSTGSTTTFNTTAVTAGQVLTIDVDQVGSTVPGSSITIQLVVTQ